MSCFCGMVFQRYGTMIGQSTTAVSRLRRDMTSDVTATFKPQQTNKQTNKPVMVNIVAMTSRIMIAR